MNNPLLDKDFLLQLDRAPQKNKYAKITLLSWDEVPLEAIEGKITTGSISLDGNSALRRTCSLTMLLDMSQKMEYEWALHTKFILEIGLQNDINSNYPEIIWFKQGVFVFTQFNISLTTSGYTASIQGKDKMCLLNGDIGGNLNASIDFGTEEIVDIEAEMTTYEKLPLLEVIRNVVTMWGNELNQNVLINDLDSFGFELLEYRGDKPIFLIYQAGTSGQEVIQITFEKNVSWVSENGYQGTSFDDPDHLKYETMGLGVSIPATRIQFGEIWDPTAPSYTIGKCEYGDAAGYRLCDLVYAGDLTANINETVTSILDKIKKMLGNYEYFYDVNGTFIFQKKPALAVTHQSSQKSAQILPYSINDYIAYYFNDLSMISSINNNPTLNNLKNDYTIWGTRQAVSGASIPVEYRFALDVQPTKYTTLDYITENNSLHYYSETYFTSPKVEQSVSDAAREQYIAFAKQRNQALEEAEQIENIDDRIKEQRRIKQAFNDNIHNANIISSIQWDYRELIYQMAQDWFNCNQKDNYIDDLIAANPTLYFTHKTGYEQYYTDIYSRWREIYDLSYAAYLDNGIKKYQLNPITLYEYDEFGYNRYYNEAPWKMSFQFELSNTNNYLQDIMIVSIGDRSKVINESTINAIYYPTVPNQVFYTEGLNQKLKDLTSAYTKIHLTPSIASLFSISSRNISAIERMQELIYDFTYCTESISLQTIPVYYLEPNQRIAIVDSQTGLNGEYIISKITLPLDYKGMMTIQATKAAENIIINDSILES